MLHKPLFRCSPQTSQIASIKLGKIWSEEILLTPMGVLTTRSNPQKSYPKFRSPRTTFENLLAWSERRMGELLDGWRSWEWRHSKSVDFNLGFVNSNRLTRQHSYNSQHFRTLLGYSVTSRAFFSSSIYVSSYVSFLTSLCALQISTPRSLLLAITS